MTPQPPPKRCKGADHFGYGHQVALGKAASDGDGLWHSHGKYYHNPNTYWCGGWGDRTPEELLSECQSIIADMRIYHPELFQSRPAPAHNEHYTGVCAMQDKCNDYLDFLESIEDELSSDDEDPVCPIKCKLRMNPQSLRLNGVVGGDNNVD